MKDWIVAAVTAPGHQNYVRLDPHSGCVWNHSCAGPPHRPLTSRVFVWPADPRIGPPLWVPGPWMLYHCFLWEAGNWMTGYLLQQHPVLEKSSLHSYPPIIMLSEQLYARGHPGGFWCDGWVCVGLSDFRLKSIFVPIQMFPSKLWGQEWSLSQYSEQIV